MVSASLLLFSHIIESLGWFPETIKLMNYHENKSLEKLLPCDQNTAKVICENRVSILNVFFNSISIIVTSSIFFALYDTFYAKLWADLHNLTEKRESILDNMIYKMEKESSSKLSDILKLLYHYLRRQSFIYQSKALKFPRKFIKYIFGVIYMADEIREENEFLLAEIGYPVLVSLKSGRVYVGVLNNVDLRDKSDDDDALILILSYSGFRMDNGTVDYITFYKDHNPDKLIFMREVESISHYDERVTDEYIKQGSLSYSVHGDKDVQMEMFSL